MSMQKVIVKLLDSVKKYKCCKCDFCFEDKKLNWYLYAKENASVICPNCKTRLVADYDFRQIEKFSKWSDISFYISILISVSIWLITSNETLAALIFLGASMPWIIFYILYKVEIIRAENIGTSTRPFNNV